MYYKPPCFLLIRRPSRRGCELPCWAGRWSIWTASSRTQEVARAAARAGAAEGLAVVAGQQTAGKGRAGRSWWSPPAGGLYLSLLLRPDLPGEHTPWVTMTLALGRGRGHRSRSAASHVDIKWPNDLQWQGRKLAGVLAEGAFTGGRLDYVIAGIGLNVAIDFSAQPELADSAVSLHTRRGPGRSTRSTLLAALLERTEQHYLALRDGQSPLPAWQARLHTLGRPSALAPPTATCCTASPATSCPTARCVSTWTAAAALWCVPAM